jgi:nitrite reductase (NADH) small subunit
MFALLDAFIHCREWMSPARGDDMPPYERVAAAGDIPPGRAKTVAVGGREVAVFNADGTYYAIEATCPHQGGPLAEGWLDGTLVTCPWHAWCFDLRTGRMALAGDFCSVDTFDVRVEGADVEVDSEPRR